MNEKIRKITVGSTLDGSEEPSLLYLPPEPDKAPLLVGLHTWSCDRFNQVDKMLPYCEERGWALILPEFRGPNLDSNPRAIEACGSALARGDIIDAVNHALSEHPLDAASVFVLGGSGGGHMALRIAAEAPEKFAGVSAWVPITDLAAWHGQNSNYAKHIAACCGGVPGQSPEIDAEYRDRSPINFIDSLAKSTLSVHHGRWDNSVPYTHSYRLAAELEKAGAERFYFEIFDGGHELRYERAFSWFDSLQEKKSTTKKLTG